MLSGSPLILILAVLLSNLLTALTIFGFPPIAEAQSSDPAACVNELDPSSSRNSLSANQYLDLQEAEIRKLSEGLISSEELDIQFSAWRVALRENTMDFNVIARSVDASIYVDDILKLLPEFEEVETLLRKKIQSMPRKSDNAKYPFILDEIEKTIQTLHQLKQYKKITLFDMTAYIHRYQLLSQTYDRQFRNLYFHDNTEQPLQFSYYRIGSPALFTNIPRWSVKKIAVASSLSIGESWTGDSIEQVNTFLANQQLPILLLPIKESIMIDGIWVATEVALTHDVSHSSYINDKYEESRSIESNKLSIAENFINWTKSRIARLKTYRAFLSVLKSDTLTTRERELLKIVWFVLTHEQGIPLDSYERITKHLKPSDANPSVYNPIVNKAFVYSSANHIYKYSRGIPAEKVRESTPEYSEHEFDQAIIKMLKLLKNNPDIPRE